MNDEIAERIRREEKGRRLAQFVTEHRNGYYVRSESSSKIYNITQGTDGGWCCTCDSYKYRPVDPVKRRDFFCLHIYGVLWSLKTGRIKGIDDLRESRGRFVTGVERGRTTRGRR